MPESCGFVRLWPAVAKSKAAMLTAVREKTTTRAEWNRCVRGDRAVTARPSARRVSRSRTRAAGGGERRRPRARTSWPTAMSVVPMIMSGASNGARPSLRSGAAFAPTPGLEYRCLAVRGAHGSRDQPIRRTAAALVDLGLAQRALLGDEGASPARESGARRSRRFTGLVRESTAPPSWAFTVGVAVARPGRSLILLRDGHGEGERRPAGLVVRGREPAAVRFDNGT